ncbi:MAG: hypothetical protein GY754_19820 [bacterium]|nr:hypothetical protein [bacterium]
MKKVILLIPLVIIAFLIVSISYYNNIEIGNPSFAGNCFGSDVQEQCCPMACKAEKDGNRDKANKILRNCMASVLECGSSKTDSANVFSNCNCN